MAAIAASAAAIAGAMPAAATDFDPRYLPDCLSVGGGDALVSFGLHYVILGPDKGDGPICVAWYPGFERWGGADRYEVSAALSSTVHSPGVETVFIANGLASADALAAGPVAALGDDTGGRGPILLVRKDGTPAVVAAELDRLDPAEIVVLGGIGSVSSVVEARLGTYTSSVKRWEGADRYEVSATISLENFEPGVGTVFLANGLASADALAAGPVAGIEEGPVLLVKKDGIPSAVAAELDRLSPSRIVLLGGTGSVSEAVEVEAASYADTVERWGGADRYAVAATVSAVNYPNSGAVVFIANGIASADALAAGPVAAVDYSPLLLVKKDSIPAVVHTELKRLNPARIIILGGTGSVSEEVEEQLTAYLRVFVRTESLPIAELGIPYPETTMSALGGVPPYTWSASGLPVGLSLSPAGVLSGTPTTLGDYMVKISVTDAVGSSASDYYRIFD